MGDWVEAGTARLHVRRWGPADGPPFLFLHALGPASSAAFVGVGVGPLAAAGWSIAAPDMPGYGESPPLEPDGYTAANLAALVGRLADSLGWERFALGGHSWGGAVAVHAVAAQPERVRALVLVDSGHLDYADSPGADLTATLEQMTAEAEANRRRAKDRAEIVADLELPEDDPVVEAYMAGMQDDGEGGLISRTLGSSRARAMYHLMRARQSEQWAAIAAAETPTLLLLATKPEEIRAQNQAAAARFGAAIPQADIRMIEGASHSLITDLRDEFGRTLADWLAQVP